MTRTIVDMADVGRMDRTQELMTRARRLRAEAAGDMVKGIGIAGWRLLKRVKTYFGDSRLMQEVGHLDDRLLADAGLNRATRRHG